MRDKPLTGGSFTDGVLAYVENVTKHAAVGAIMGGLTSVALGGDFSYGAKQGAMTSAIAYTTNCGMSEVAGRFRQAQERKSLQEDTKEDLAVGDSYRHRGEIKRGNKSDDVPFGVRVLNEVGKGIRYTNSTREEKIRIWRNKILKRTIDYYLDEEWPRQYRREQERYRQHFERVEVLRQKVYGG